MTTPLLIADHVEYDEPTAVAGQFPVRRIVLGIFVAVVAVAIVGVVVWYGQTNSTFVSDTMALDDAVKPNQAFSSSSSSSGPAPYCDALPCPPTNPLSVGDGVVSGIPVYVSGGGAYVFLVLTDTTGIDSGARTFADSLAGAYQYDQRRFVVVVISASPVSAALQNISHIVSALWNRGYLCPRFVGLGVGGQTIVQLASALSTCEVAARHQFVAAYPTNVALTDANNIIKSIFFLVPQVDAFNSTFVEYYNATLTQRRIDHQIVVYPNTTHGFLNQNTTVTQTAIKDIVNWLFA